MRPIYFTAIIPMFFILFMFTIGESAYGWTVDELKARYKIDDSEFPIFMNDKYIIEADDGNIVVIRKLNPAHDKNVRNTQGFVLIGGGGEFIQVDDEIYYLVLCADEQHILLSFNDEKNYFQKHKDTIKLEKHGDFKNISSYKFTYLTYSQQFFGLSDERILATELIWLDKKMMSIVGVFDIIYLIAQMLL